MLAEMSYRFAIRRLAEDEGGDYLIEFPDLPGCMSDGRRSKKRSPTASPPIRGLIEALGAEGYPIPAPSRSAHIAGNGLGKIVARGSHIPGQSVTFRLHHAFHAARQKNP
jgi:predicted RNase H-like HicB family nuclease